MPPQTIIPQPPRPTRSWMLLLACRRSPCRRQTHWRPSALERLIVHLSVNTTLSHWSFLKRVVSSQALSTSWYVTRWRGWRTGRTAGCLARRSWSGSRFQTVPEHVFLSPVMVPAVTEIWAHMPEGQIKVKGGYPLISISWRVNNVRLSCQEMRL